MKAIGYNPAESSDDNLEVAAKMAAAGKLGGGVKTGNDSFFSDKARSFLWRALDLLRSADEGRPPSILDVKRLATERPEKDEKHGPFYLGLEVEIHARYPSFAAMPTATRDALDYFENEFRTMPERQKGGVVGYPFIQERRDDACI